MVSKVLDYFATNQIFIFELKLSSQRSLLGCDMYVINTCCARVLDTLHLQFFILIPLRALAMLPDLRVFLPVLNT